MAGRHQKPTVCTHIDFEFVSARLTCRPTLDEIRKLKQMLVDAETISWHKKTTNETTD